MIIFFCYKLLANWLKNENCRAQFFSILFLHFSLKWFRLFRKLSNLQMLWGIFLGHGTNKPLVSDFLWLLVFRVVYWTDDAHKSTESVRPKNFHFYHLLSTSYLVEEILWTISPPLFWKNRKIGARYKFRICLTSLFFFLSFLIGEGGFVTRYNVRVCITIWFILNSGGGGGSLRGTMFVYA